MFTCDLDINHELNQHGQFHWRTGGGGGAWGRLPPQMKFNHDLFSMYQQNIERNSSLRM